MDKCAFLDPDAVDFPGYGKADFCLGDWLGDAVKSGCIGGCCKRETCDNFTNHYLDELEFAEELDTLAGSVTLELLEDCATLDEDVVLLDEDFTTLDEDVVALEDETALDDDIATLEEDSVLAEVAELEEEASLEEDVGGTSSSVRSMNPLMYISFWA